MMANRYTYTRANYAVCGKWLENKLMYVLSIFLFFRVQRGKGQGIFIHRETMEPKKSWLCAYHIR